MSDEPGQKPNIIIDEDWKTQVQAEKKAAQETQDSPAETKAQPTAAGAEMPPASLPASLPVLFSTLATQALMCMGQMANPATGKADVNLPQAKHFIDMLQVLDEKTSGHRTDEESQLLDNLLHELRMAFVAIGRQSPPADQPATPTGK